MIDGVQRAKQRRQYEIKIKMIKNKLNHLSIELYIFIFNTCQTNE